MEIIDFHTHAFPVDIAPSALAKLTDGSGYVPHHDGTIKGLEKSMKKAGITKSVICSIATKAEQINNILRWSHRVKSEKTEPFISLFPGYEFEKIIDKAVSYGLKGIKMHPQYQNFSADTEQLFPIYEAISAKGLILLMHSGFDLAYPGDLRAAPTKFLKIIKNFPKLRLVLAHFGGFRLWNEVFEKIAGHEIYMDTSFILKEDERMFYRIIKKHSSDLILFGTDSPWLSQQTEKNRILQARISDRLKEKILFKNAVALLNSVK